MLSFWKKSAFKIRTLPPGQEPERELRAPAPPAEAAKFIPVPTPAPRRCVAFVVFHGMGQQVPYETISQLAECMVRQETAIGKYEAPPAVSVVRVKITDDSADPPLARAQFSVKRDDELIDVHVYEAYWAPLTEGKISFLETLAFLFEAGFNGILSCLRGSAFKRWMFGDFQDLPIKAGTLYALVTTVAGAAIALIPVVAFSHYWKAASSEPLRVAIVVHHPILSLLSLALLGLYTWAIRYFAVEYAGDVAIYVSSHKVSRYQETREKIQETVFAIARQVYSSRNGVQPTYDKVVFVGHSLGSVIAYDTLNAAISWDVAEQGGRIHVVSRTNRLITFGSPLDKTAFLFRTQVSGPRFLREALAAQKQPLILDYQQFRPRQSFRWVNIYSRADIISGRLAYYDTPPGSANPAPNPVENVTDWQAWIPIVAHVQYWNNRKLREELYRAIE